MTTDWLWSHGHLGWPLFALVVNTLVVFLIADLAWRLLVLPTRRFAGALGALGALWLLGVAVTWVVWL